MAKNTKRTLLFTFIVFLLFSFRLVPTCDPEALLNKFAPSLEEYVFITTFKVHSEKDGDKTNYSYVLSRGTEYKIVVADDNEAGNRMIVNFYDRNKKLIATNYLKSGKKFFPAINFACQMTGMYYVEAFFENDKKGCGINILGFKKG